MSDDDKTGVASQASPASVAPATSPNTAPPAASVSTPGTAAQPAAVIDPTLKLQIEDLHVTYIGREGSRVEALCGVDFDIRDKPGVGEIVVLLGPSGCGKSTVLKCVAGLLYPTQGQVLVSGKAVDGPGRDRGMVFQQYTSFDWLTVRQNVEYGLKLAGVPSAERHTLSDHYLKLVGLDEFGGAYPKELSGGMKQRVAIARTLINKPRLVLMDEPFGALDPQTRWEMQTLLLEISRTEDNTILLVTHDVSEAVYLADTCYVLSPRPARILHRVDVPVFADRSAAVKASTEFRAIEKTLLDMLYAQPGGTA
ncbi:MAG: ATP-binding cassette domain-containing protein [Pseudomonadota bacterium]